MTFLGYKITLATMTDDMSLWYVGRFRLPISVYRIYFTAFVPPLGGVSKYCYGRTRTEMAPQCVEFMINLLRTSKPTNYRP